MGPRGGQWGPRGSVGPIGVRGAPKGVRGAPRMFVGLHWVPWGTKGIRGVPRGSVGRRGGPWGVEGVRLQGPGTHNFYFFSQGIRRVELCFLRRLYSLFFAVVCVMAQLSWLTTALPLSPDPTVFSYLTWCAFGIYLQYLIVALVS